VLVLLVFGDDDRPWAGLALVATTLWAYETVSVALSGTTLGKKAVGLRVVPLDATAKPTWGQASRRAAVDAGLAAAAVVGWIVWAVSALGDPLGRGIADRNAATMVVPAAARLPVTTHDLPGYADGARPPRLTTLGRVGDADVRVRARLRRLDQLPVLSLVLGAVVLTSTLIHATLLRVALATTVWLVLFVVDESARIARHGATAGHRLAGLVVLDRRRGTPPGMGRSVARATALGLTLYVPVLWPLLVVTLALMRWSSTGRGLHDRVAGTIVVGDPTLAPERQRQRAMAVRLGRAG